MKRTIRIVAAFINVLTTACAVIGGVFTAVMTLIVAYAVVVRYFFNSPIGWSEEISIYFMIWAVFLGTAYTFQQEGHIRVDLLVKRIPEKHRIWLYAFHYLVGFVFLALLFWEGIQMVKLSMLLGSRSIAMDIPLVIPQLSVPVGAGLLILQLFAKVLRTVLSRMEA
jgi:C4-dicarboxylate transporter DctQ subunit